MDRHLNLFRPFSLNQAKEHIEDNISRAFVLCLQNSPVLFHDFISGILKLEDYSYLFNSFNEEADFFLDLQVSLENIDASEFKSIYAIALTTEEYEMNNFFKDYSFGRADSYSPITDIFFKLNDVLMIVEVKRHGEDCRQQLYNQIHQLVNKSSLKPEDVEVKSLSWKNVLEKVFQIHNFEKYTHLRHPFLQDFVSLIRQYRSDWLPVTPFASLPEGDAFNYQRYMRLRAAVELNPEDLSFVDKGNRIGYKFPLPWSDEVLFNFLDDNTLTIAVYPGNTKGQGYSFYANSNHDWRNVKQVEVNGEIFQTSITSHIRFSGQGYITGLWFNQNEEKKPICVSQNFHKSGRIKRPDWKDFEQFLDDSFQESFNWREKCNWENKIIESNRSMFNVSFGYEVAILVPYSYLQRIDKAGEDLPVLAEFIYELYHKFNSLLEWK